MHLNQQQHHDFINNPENSTPLPSNGNAKKITAPHISDGGKFSGSEASCTSSTDSGVNISDNETTTTASPSPAPQLQQQGLPSQQSPTTTLATFNSFREQFHKHNSNQSSVDNKAKYNNSSRKSFALAEEDKEIVVGGQRRTQGSYTTFDKKYTSEQQLKNSRVESNFSASPYQRNRNSLKIENVIKNNSEVEATAENRVGAATNEQHGLTDLPRSASPASSSIISSSDTSQDPPSHHHYHRSPAVSIRSIDSSVIDSDSDSDLNGDLEGEHENYVIKKLGNQVSYPPKHPDIPKINNGLKVVNQQITPNGMSPHGLAPPSPLAVLANIGDNIGRAQSLAHAPCVSSRPQVTVSSSKDITIGDKHFYEGPVTIQQFLIDSRDKWKDSNGKDNPTFESDNDDTRNYAKDINSTQAGSGDLYGKILRRKKYIIPGVLAVLALIAVAIILGKSKNVLGNSEESRKNIPINSTIAQDNVGGGNILRIVPRDAWLAQPPINPWVPLDLPVERVIVIPTRTTNCETQAACTYTVRFTQTFNIESQQQDDIIYNFLIGGDGNVYEGRGWDNKGSTVKGYNDDSISLAYIGSFNKQKPSDKQLNVTKLLLEEGVRLNKLSSDYRIVAANKLDPASTATLANALYESFENWPHWSDH